MKYNPDKHHRRSIRLKGHDYAATAAYFITLCAYQRQCLFGEIVNGTMQLNQFGQIVADCWTTLSTRYPYVDLDAWIVMPNHFHGILNITNTPRKGDSGIAPQPSSPTDPPIQTNHDTPCKGDSGITPQHSLPTDPHIHAPTDNTPYADNAQIASQPSPSKSDRSMSFTSRNRYTVGGDIPRGGGSRTAPTDVVSMDDRPRPKRKPLGRLIGAFKTTSTKQINLIRDLPGVPVWQRNYYEHIMRRDDWNPIRWYIHNNPRAWEEDQLHPDQPSN